MQCKSTPHLLQFLQAAIHISDYCNTVKYRSCNNPIQWFTAATLRFLPALHNTSRHMAWYTVRLTSLEQNSSASDQQVANAGSIPWPSRGFFSYSQLSVQTPRDICTPSCSITCIYIRAYVKDPVVHVRVWRNMETLKHPACTVGWVAQLCRSWLSLGKATHWRNPTGIGTIQL